VIDRLELIISIYDYERLNNKGKYRVYTSALVTLYRLKNDERVDDTYRIFEVEYILASRTKRPRELYGYRLFEIHDIIRSTYIVPTKREGYYYINNFID